MFLDSPSLTFRTVSAEQTHLFDGMDNRVVRDCQRTGPDLLESLQTEGGTPTMPPYASVLPILSVLCLTVGERSNREQGTKRAGEWDDVQVARIKHQAHGVQEHYDGSSRALSRCSTSCTDGIRRHKKGRLQQGQTVRGYRCRRCNQVSRRLRQLQLVTKWIFVASVP